MAVHYRGREPFKGYKCMPNGTVSGSGISPRPIASSGTKSHGTFLPVGKILVYGLLIERGTMNNPENDKQIVEKRPGGIRNHGIMDHVVC